MSIKILIIEDEKPTQRMLEGLISTLRPEWQIQTCLTNVEEAIEWFQQNPQPDLIFSDIQLSDGTCFEIYEVFPPESFIIFTTAYDEYAIQAFTVNSLDYLLKPVSEEKLEKALLKFESLYHEQERIPIADKINELACSLNSDQKKYRSRIMVNTTDGFYALDISDVCFFESSHKQVSATSSNKHQHMVDFTLDRLEKELDPTQFFRVNRQFIVHIDAIAKVEYWFNGKLILKTQPVIQEKIVVSRDRAKAFKAWINQ